METNIDLEVVCDRNEDTVAVIETQLSSDSEETEGDSHYLESFHNSFSDSIGTHMEVVVIETQLTNDLDETERQSNYFESFNVLFGDSNVNSIENHKRDVNRIRKKYYVWIRSLFAILISVGYPLHNWLISGDPLRDSYSKYKKLWKVIQWLYIILAFLSLYLILLNAILPSNSDKTVFSIHLALLNISSIYPLFAFHWLHNKGPIDILTTCFITSDTERQINNRGIIEANPRTNFVLHIVYNVCLITVPILVVVICAFVKSCGLTPFIFTLTALNLITITINFAICTKFRTVLKQQMESLASHLEEHVSGYQCLDRPVSFELLDQFYNR